MALQPRNQRKLHDVLMAVSDPFSDAYGQHLSLDELAALVAPSAAVLDAVAAWIAAAGADVVSLVPTKDFVTVRAVPAAAERLLATRFVRFEHGPHSLVRALEPYSVPRELAEHVAFVTNVHGLPPPPKPKAPRTTTAVGGAAVGADPLIGPVQLRQRYNVTTIGAKNPKNAQAVAEFQAQYYSPSDLNSFFAQVSGRRCCLSISQIDVLLISHLK